MIECNFGKTKNLPPRCSKNTFPEIFHIKLSFLHLIQDGVNGVRIYQLTDADCGFVIIFCVAYLVKTQNHLISSNTM